MTPAAFTGQLSGIGFRAAAAGLLIFLYGGIVQSSAPASQLEAPRRRAHPETIRLAGNSSVEFRSFPSRALGGQARYSIFLPPDYHLQPGRRFPVIYFLHGMNNDHTSWTVSRYGNLPQLLEDLLLAGELPPFLMVHPDGENSFYTNFLEGTRRYEDLVVGDLVQEVETRFRARPERRNRVLAGTSMGAYGALKIGMKHPRQYQAVAAASPIILLGEDPLGDLSRAGSRRANYFLELFRPIFGLPFDRQHWQENSVEVLARTADLEGLEIYLAYGTADRYRDRFPMEEGIHTVHEALNARGISHEFHAFPGEPHGWGLIQNHLKEILHFLTRSFP